MLRQVQVTRKTIRWFITIPYRAVESSVPAQMYREISGVRPGTYTVTAGVDDGCGICGETKTSTIEVRECPDCEELCTCPTVSVTGPSAVVQPGETMTFTANVSGGSQTDATYNWSVDKGTIVEGQGTPVITVSTEGLSTQPSLQLLGLVVSVRNVVAKTVRPVWLETNPTGRLVDEFGPLANDDVKARLDPFVLNYRQTRVQPVISLITVLQDW